MTGRSKAIYNGLLASLGTALDFGESSDTIYNRDLSTSTVSRKIAAVKSLFTLAHKIGYVCFNVGQAVRQPTPRRRLNERLL